MASRRGQVTGLVSSETLSVRPLAPKRPDPRHPAGGVAVRVRVTAGLEALRPCARRGLRRAVDS